MKFIITEEQSEKLSQKVKSTVEKYGIKHAMGLFDKEIIKRVYKNNRLEFLEPYKNLTPVKEGKKTYYVDKNGWPIFSYYTNEKMHNVFVNEDLIWYFFKKTMGLREMTIQELISNWMVKNYNIHLTPISWDFSFYRELNYR